MPDKTNIRNECIYYPIPYITETIKIRRRRKEGHSPDPYSTDELTHNKQGTFPAYPSSTRLEVKTLTPKWKALNVISTQAMSTSFTAEAAASAQMASV